MAILNLMSASLRVTPPTGMWEPLLMLFSFIKNYGWRVILFTVLLKLVLSPLDFFQRYKMKKNQLITEKLAPELERLKKQCAGDTRTFQQQQMRLQKSMGYSIVASCLPMIITLVVFLTFFMGIRSISQYEEFKQYVELYEVYSAEYTELTGLSMTGDGTQIEDYDDIVFNEKITIWADENDITESNSDEKTAFNQYKNDYNGSFKQMHAELTGLKGYVRFFNDKKVAPSNASLYSDVTVFLKNGYFDIDAVKNAPASADKTRAEQEIVDALNEILNALNTEQAANYNLGRSTYASFAEVYDDYEKLDTETELNKNINILLSVAESLSADRAYEYFKQENARFLWIKSLWVADIPTKDAIRGFNSFRGSVSKYLNTDSNAGDLPGEVLSDLNSEETYKKVMLKIRKDKSLSGVNGYLILAILAVGLAALSQFLTTRQQKKAGQPGMGMNGNSMKMMMFIMPLMVGVFAVTSTSAFALYMITNSAMSLLINLSCTAAVNLIFRNKAKKETSDSGVVKYGRRDPNDYIDKRSK